MIDIERIAARLFGDIQRQAQRTSRIMRPGVVEEYDPKTHKARVRLNTGQGAPLLSPKAPVIESGAGGQTSRTTLTKGQTVWVFCPNGDLRNAQVFAGTFSDEFKSTSTEADETRFERGGVRVAIRPDEAEMSFGETTVRVKDGKVAIHTTGTAEFT